MKYAIVFTILTAGLSLAQPHRHAHRHAHVDKRSPTADVVNVPGPTVVVFELNGKTISESDVQQGLKNGTLKWAGDGAFSVAPSSTVASSTSAPSPIISSAKPTSTSIYVAPTSSTSVAASTSAAASSVAPSSANAAPSAASYSGSSLPDANNVEADFPDGELDCSTFPSDHGAVSVEWMGLGGWTGIQQPGSSGDGGFDDIMTVTSQTCSNGNCCTEGSFCSYACPAGYQKSQWPTKQGATGQSVGGIQCVNGKLRLTNPSLSKKLCMTGTEKVSVQIVNKMSQNAAVCRTDYPGTEGETVPLDAQPGTTSNLTCPDGAHYYNWKGAPTSAQYYVNPKGVSVKDACQWGTAARPWGNFAPLNLGVGYSAGSAWLSIFQNAPTTDAKLDFSIEIVGNHGGYENLSGRCKYENGQYCSGEHYESCSKTTGCTISVSSGSATFIFSS
ncbi:hypothetical protein B0A49_04377 [Cryomyces minteri]|uniref:Secreted beta-glucosidase sun1 n=1 Tax=Cryomyces minteri TaxID=331657 RepID=A0A4U0X6K9_9PEZI|nr:hypothetical protein B0A49_04377 [Cryomyces minteri]